MKRIIGIFAIVALFFLYSASMGNGRLRPTTNIPITSCRDGLGQNSLGFNTVRHSMDVAQNGDDTGQIQGLLGCATVYANLTRSVFLVAESNSSLLNSKGHYWIAAHQNITTSKGDLSEGSVYAGRIYEGIETIEIRYMNYRFLVKIRYVKSASEIDEIREDVEEAIAPKITVTRAFIWIVQGLISGSVAMVIVGKWRMNRI